MKGVGAAGRGAKAINKGVILMFGISLNPVSLLATAALGPMGPLGQLAAQVVSQFGQQLIQQIGDRLNLPQSAIDFAQADYASSKGDVLGTAQNLNEAIEQYGQEAGANFRDIGDAQRTINDLLRQQATDAAESEEAREAKSSGGAGGWLRALAHALGKVADKGAADLEQRAKGLDGAKPSETAEFGADTAAFNLLMNGINNAIKTIGESLGTMARKQ